MEPFGYPLTQLAAASLMLAMVLGVAARLYRMFPYGKSEHGWIIVAALFGGIMLLFGVWIGKLIGAVTGAMIVILVWIIGEIVHARREHKQNESCDH